MTALCEQLRTARKTLKLSQKELAAGLCSQAYVSQIERGTRVPTARLFKALVAKLNLPLADVFRPYLQECSITQAYTLVQLVGEDDPTLALKMLLAIQRYLDDNDYLNPHEPQQEETLAYIQFQQGTIDAALDQYERVIEQRARVPSRPVRLIRSFYNAGATAANLGRYERAETYLQQAFSRVMHLDPHDTPVANEAVRNLQLSVTQALGYVLLQQRKSYAARQAFEYARRTWDGLGYEFGLMPPDLVIAIAHAEIAAGSLKTAGEMLDELLDQELAALDRAHAMHNRGIIHRMRGDLAHARKLFGRAVRIYGEERMEDVCNVSNELARVELGNGNFKSAKQWLDKVVSSTPTLRARFPNILAEGYLIQSRLMHARGKRQEAAKWLDRIASINGVHPLFTQLVAVERCRQAGDNGPYHGDLQRLVQDLERQLL